MVWNAISKDDESFSLRDDFSRPQYEKFISTYKVIRWSPVSSFPFEVNQIIKKEPLLRRGMMDETFRFANQRIYECENGERILVAHAMIGDDIRIDYNKTYLTKVSRWAKENNLRCNFYTGQMDWFANKDEEHKNDSCLIVLRYLAKK